MAETQNKYPAISDVQTFVKTSDGKTAFSNMLNVDAFKKTPAYQALPEENKATLDKFLQLKSQELSDVGGRFDNKLRVVVQYNMDSEINAAEKQPVAYIHIGMPRDNWPSNTEKSGQFVPTAHYNPATNAATKEVAFSFLTEPYFVTLSANAQSEADDFKTRVEQSIKTHKISQVIPDHVKDLALAAVQPQDPTSIPERLKTAGAEALAV